MALEVKNLGVNVGTKVLLENVSFSAKAQTLHAIVGPNGAGKTTLLRALAALQPYRGSACFETDELRDVDPKVRATWMAYLPQFLSGVNLSVLEVLELSRRPFGTPSKQRRLIDNQIEAFGLQSFLNTSLNVLSGGQRQMVMIAAALLQSPRLLLLDEPVSHLDPKNRLEVLQRLSDATREQNITTLIVLHDLQHALHYCDALLLMREGELLSHSRSCELEASQLSTLYGVEARLFRHEGHPYVAFAHRHGDQSTSHLHKG